MKPNPSNKPQTLGARVPATPLVVIQAASRVTEGKGHIVPKPPVNLPVRRPPGDPIAKPNSGQRVPVQPPTKPPPTTE